MIWKLSKLWDKLLIREIQFLIKSSRGASRPHENGSCQKVCRPHFWCYYRAPEDSLDDVAMAIRLYGQPEKWEISVEVSFVERKKSDTTLAKQHKVLDLPIAPFLYYFAQEDGVSHRVEGTEANRQMLKEAVKDGRVRKVLVKYDVPVTSSLTEADLIDQLMEGFQLLMPYYDSCHDTNELL